MKFRLIAVQILVILALFLPFQPVLAKRPPEIRNQEDLNISNDMHGLDLTGYEFVKYDLKGIDFSESILNGAVFNNSRLIGANLHLSDMTDSLAYATNFDEADLSQANLTNSLLMESTFEKTNIDGADFTDAVLSRIQQKKLCSMATGTNLSSGIETSYSLGC